MSPPTSRPEARSAGSPPPLAGKPLSNSKGRVTTPLGTLRDKLSLAGTECLAQMPDARGSEYESLSAAMAANLPVGKPVQRLAALAKIRDLLDAKASDGRTLGSILAERARDPSTALATAIVIGHLSGDIPVVQGQDSAATGAATFQVALLRDRPAEYARVVLDLASVGRTTVGGTTYELPATPSALRGRSPVSVYFQDVFAQASADPKGGVDATRFAGLYRKFGMKPLVDFDSKGALKALAGGKPVPVVIRFPGGQLQSVQAQRNSDGRLTYIDPLLGVDRELDPAAIAGKVNDRAANALASGKQPQGTLNTVQRRVGEVLVRGIDAIRSGKHGKLEEIARAVNAYLPLAVHKRADGTLMDEMHPEAWPRLDGSGGVAVAEEFNAAPPKAPGQTAKSKKGRGQARGDSSVLA